MGVMSLVLLVGHSWEGIMQPYLSHNMKYAVTLHDPMHAIRHSCSN